MDRYESDKRSGIMRRIRSRDTKPEMVVRRVVHSMGYRYRLHVKDLPGRPDLAFPSKKKVIFVHGCFWHQHRGCSKARRPASKQDFWDSKLDANLLRDAQNQLSLKKMGWGFLIIWECELRDMNRLRDILKMFVDSPSP